MCMINCCVYNRSVNRTLFPWRILSINEPGTTIEQYFEQRVFKEIEDPPQELQTITGAVAVFGPFLKYHVSVVEQPLPATQATDAFAMMMRSSVPERSKKDKLYNDVLKLLKDEDVAFPGSEIQSSGRRFMVAIVDCL